MQIVQFFNNNCFKGRLGWKPKWLILHATAGGTSAQEIAQFFKNTEGSDNPVSATYVVDQAGVIYQCNSEADGPYANGVVTGGHDPWWNANGNPNPNYVTISIEHVKPDSANATAITPAQQAASFALIKDICIRNGIGMHDADENTGITGHFAIDPINRARCPGNFPWNELWNYLGGNKPMDSVLNHGWTDDGTTLKSPDGTPVTLGFRDHILNGNWDPANVPLESAQHFTILEQSNPSLGAGQRQLCRKTSLEYTPKQGVFEGWIGKELQWHIKQYAALQSQVADLQNQLDSSVQAQTIAALEAKITQAQKDLS